VSLPTNNSGALRDRGAFSLLELLVVLAISSLVIAILLPSLSSARESANIAVCLTNLREVGAAAGNYIEDVGFPTQPWHLGFDYPGADIDTVSEFVYGGFQSQKVHPLLGDKMDARKVHTNDRPFNRYIAPGLCEGPVEAYVCPSDDFTATTRIETPCSPPLVTNTPSWSINGNSYAMNWNWLDSPPWSSKLAYYKELKNMSAAGREMLRLKVGGSASRFVLFMEGPMNAYLQDAKPPNGSSGQSCQTRLGTGWHGGYSRYTIGFFDGHAEYRFIDTRFSRGQGYETWPEAYTLKGF
jgi:prepilin-type N-terminal cleavage/methylation domain-containing protein/prepilin-type processing-associated H-X9-DG protein